MTSLGGNVLQHNRIPVNAVFHAKGMAVSDLPIWVEKLLETSAVPV